MQSRKPLMYIHPCVQISSEDQRGLGPPQERLDLVGGAEWYTGTSLTRNSLPLGPYSRTMPRVGLRGGVVLVALGGGACFF